LKDLTPLKERHHLTIVPEKAVVKKRYRTRPRKRNIRDEGLTEENAFSNGGESKRSSRKSGIKQRKLLPDEEANLEHLLYKTKMPYYDEKGNQTLISIDVVRRGLNRVFIRAYNPTLKLSSSVDLHLK
jgi:hypothetical protein